MEAAKKGFVLFVNIREYDPGSGAALSGDLSDNYFCIDPERAELTGDMAFVDYIVENGERVGVRLLCDPGFVNEAGGPLLAELRVGGRYKFAHTEPAGANRVGRLRGYSLKLYEAAHDHSHDHSHDRSHDCDHGCSEACSHDCAGCCKAKL